MPPLLLLLVEWIGRMVRGNAESGFIGGVGGGAALETGEGRMRTLALTQI